MLDLISRNPDCALCPWDPEGATLEEAVPGLDKLTRGRLEWRAIVLKDGDTFGYESIDKRNPFDLVNAVKALNTFGEADINDLLDEYEGLDELDPKTDEEKEKLSQRKQELDAVINQKIAESAAKIEEFRKRKRENYQRAAESPLVKLAVWMAGSPVHNPPEKNDLIPEELLEKDCVVDRAYFETLKKVGYLPAELEQYRADCYKYECLSGSMLTDAVLKKLPEQVIVLAERLADRADDIFQEVKVPHEELEYNNFCDDNLYSAALSFVVFDVEYESRQRNAGSFLRFSSFLHMLAINDLPDSALMNRRVYSGHIRINEGNARRFFTKYYRKLNATKRLLNRKLRELKVEREETQLSDEEVIELFESDMEIPVTIQRYSERTDYLAGTNIGLSKDCPINEYDHWYNFVIETTKKFVRYLREPCRAVKNAVKGKFRDVSVIDDERILYLNEEKLEDIEFRLQEEEQKMVETTTARVFQTKHYTKQIEQADKVVREGIAKRMTRTKALVTGLIAVVAFVFGFLPLILRNLKDVETLVATFKIVGIAAGGLILIGLVFLFVQRYLQIRRIKHFNAVIHDIFDEIENGLDAFSRYLSHAVNVMREFSVLDYHKKPHDKLANTLKKHLSDIQHKIDGINGMFVSIAEADDDIGEMPYNFDFTQPEDYVYDVPYDEVEAKIPFIVPDNYVCVPIDYVLSVELRREELYD